MQQFRLNLPAQRENLTSWLRKTPPRQKQIRLGPQSERAVHSRLQLLDETIEKAEAETLGLCRLYDDYVETRRLHMHYTCCVCLDHISRAEREQLEYELELSTNPHSAPKHQLNSNC